MVVMLLWMMMRMMGMMSIQCVDHFVWFLIARIVFIVIQFGIRRMHIFVIEITIAIVFEGLN